MKSPLSAHMTDDLVALIGVELMRRQSVRSISRRFGPSEDMIYKVLDAMDTPKPYLPRVLCIDEFRANTDAGKMSVCVVDGIRGVLIDILRDRRPETLDTWFSQFSEEELESVDCLCCDMYWGFINAAERWLPCAEVCIDRFHVMRCTTKAFDKVRTRLQREVGFDIKRDLKRTRKLFLMRKSHLEGLDAKRIESDKEPLACRVEDLLKMNEELEVAYVRLQAFYHFVDKQANTQNRRRAFGNWISVSQSCGIPEMESVAKTFKKHRENILNGFRLDKTNAPAEGVNNAIKALKRACFGFKDFERMRKRCLLCLGTYQLEESNVALKKINHD